MPPLSVALDFYTLPTLTRHRRSLLGFVVPNTSAMRPSFVLLSSESSEEPYSVLSVLELSTSNFTISK